MCSPNDYYGVLTTAFVSSSSFFVLHQVHRVDIKPLLKTMTLLQDAIPLNVRQVKRLFHYCHCADSPWVRCLVYPPMPLCVCSMCSPNDYGCTDHGLCAHHPRSYLAIIRVDGQCIVAAYGKPEYADTAAQVVNAPAFRTKVSTGQRIRKFEKNGQLQPQLY